MLLFVWASCVKIRWVSWPKLLPLLWCLGLFLYIFFWSGPSAATFYMFWALSVRFFLCLGLPCVISFFVWALFVYRSMPGGPDTTGLYKKKAQTQKQPTQTRPRTENSMQCLKAQEIYREGAQAQKKSSQTRPRTLIIYTSRAQTQSKSTQTSPKHTTNLHKQCLEQMSPCKTISKQKKSTERGPRPHGPDKEVIYTSKAQTNKESTQRAQSTRNLDCAFRLHGSSVFEKNEQK